MKRKIKSISVIALVALMLSAWLGGCRRASDNGDLDGLWRIERIEYLTDGEVTETVEPEGLFYAVQLELFQLDAPNPKVTAVMSYRKGSKTLGLDFPTKPSATVLRGYGIMENPCEFKIEKLSHRHLVMSCSGSRVSCTRF